MDHAERELYFGTRKPELRDDYRKVVFQPGCTELLTLDSVAPRWSEVRDHLAAYLVDINDGRHGTVAPNTSAMYSMLRRYTQTSLFVELGITSKKDYSIGMVLRPVIEGVTSNYAIPVTIAANRKHPDVRYTTFGYESWGQAHDSLIHGVSSNPVELPKQVVPTSFAHDVVLRKLSLLDMDDAFTDQLNVLMLATLRKYILTPGPHSYNMPLIQVTLFDSDLSDQVYQRYAMFHKDVLVGYYVSEVTDNFFTVTHCIVDSERLALCGLDLKASLFMVLRHMMNTDPSLRFKVIHRSHLINTYITG